MGFPGQIANGAKMDELLLYVMELQKENSIPIGFQWDTTGTSPTLQNIDIDGDVINPFTSFFNNHPLFQLIKCVRDRTTGIISYGNNKHGDGLNLTGAAGDVLTQVPTGFETFKMDGDFAQWVVIPYSDEETQYPYAPAMYQRGGVAHSRIFVGTFEAYGALDGATFKLGSASGKQPVTGAVAYTDLPNAGRLTITDAEQYANNIGAGFGICNYHTWSYLRKLMYTEYATFNLQSALGQGVVNLTGDVGFVGKNTGADSIQSGLNDAGTGKGTGLDGETPIQWRNIENPLIGNVNEYLAGINFYANGDVRVVNRSGRTTANAAIGNVPITLSDATTYETITGTSITNGYPSAIVTTEYGGLFLPTATAANNITGLCDYFTHATVDQSGIRAGGSWASQLAGGPGYMYPVNLATYSARDTGCRIEFIEQL